MAEADPKTQKMPDEETTSSQGPHAPRRDRSPERNYPEFERHDPGVNPTDAGAPRGPVNIGVKRDTTRGPAPGPAREDHPATGTQGSSSLPEE